MADYPGTVDVSRLFQVAVPDGRRWSGNARATNGDQITIQYIPNVGSSPTTYTLTVTDQTANAAASGTWPQVGVGAASAWPVLAALLNQLGLVIAPQTGIVWNSF